MGKREAEARQCSETERGFTSSILTTKITKKLSKMLGENWRDLWHQPRLVKDKSASRKWLQSRKSQPRRIPRNWRSSKSCQHGNLRESREKWRSFSKHEGCHLKNAELEPKLQKQIKGIVVLCGDVVKDDSGAYAVFTEHCSSASQRTARLPDCDGQAADAVSDFTQVEIEDAPRLLKISKSECPDIWIRLPRHKWRNPGQTSKIQWF